MLGETWQQWVDGEGLQMLSADAWSGNYREEIVQMDDHYLLRVVSENIVMHDRLLLGADYSIGQTQTISYREGVG